jgi:hypothetical protein
MGGAAAVRGKGATRRTSLDGCGAKVSPAQIESSDAFTGQIAFGHETQGRSAAAFFACPDSPFNWPVQPVLAGKSLQPKDFSLPFH